MRVSCAPFTFVPGGIVFTPLLIIFPSNREMSTTFLFSAQGNLRVCVEESFLFSLYQFFPLWCWFCVGGMWRLWVCLFPVVKVVSCLCGCGGALSLHESSWAHLASPCGPFTVAQSLSGYASLNQSHLTGDHLSY